MSATRNAGALASGRLSPLLALEIPSTGRATADRDRIARADPADEHGEFALGSTPERHAGFAPASIHGDGNTARLADNSTPALTRVVGG